ncbi:MAG: V-type ATP synthase subunit B, partial [Candidatus Omnitrophota bacterium]
MFREYQTVSQIQGPLLVVKKIEGVKYAELAEVILPQGERRFGKVLEVTEDLAIIQIFEGTRGLD